MSGFGKVWRSHSWLVDGYFVDYCRCPDVDLTMTDKERQELRAALLQMAKALRTQHDCVMRIVSLLQAETKPAEVATIPPGDNVAFTKTVV